VKQNGAEAVKAFITPRTEEKFSCKCYISENEIKDGFRSQTFMMPL